MGRNGVELNPWIVYATEADAKAGLASIDAGFGYPLTGINAKTGAPAPEAQQTRTWSVPVQRVTDGKWCFPAPPAEHRSVDPPHTIEEYNLNWFPEPPPT
jgi:hypothetical protein